MARILVIGAHADDAEYGAGGLIQRFDERRIVIATDGARGGSADMRRHEASTAACTLGAMLRLCDLVDTRLHAADLIPVLEEEIRGWKPDVIATTAICDSHQDHRAVHHATVIASRDAMSTVLAYLTPSAADQGFSPNWFEPLSEEMLQKKLEALRCHKSQRERPYLTGAHITSTARYWASVARATDPYYVEPFQLIRHRARWT